MSWEDCGYKPGKIEGRATCPAGRCGDCDGEHHFYVRYGDDEENERKAAADPNFEPEPYFSCKHCEARATMVQDDEYFAGIDLDDLDNA